MSVDVYLLPLQPDEDFEAAMVLFTGLEDRTMSVESSFDVRPLHEVIMKLDPRYQRTETKYAEVARFVKGIGGDLNDHFLSLHGKSEAGLPLSQFNFHRGYVIIHEYPGTTSDQMDRFIDTICRSTGLAVVYPAFGEVHRVGDEGWFSPS